MPPNSDVLEAPLRHVYKPLPHDSGAKHVQGSAEYIDDIPEPIGTLHIAVGGTPVARGTLRRLDLSEVRNAPGVVAVVTAADIPGKNDISPGSADEPVLVQDTILFHHQPVFAVAATSRDAARRAVLRAKIEVDAEAPNVSVEQGRASGETVMPDYAFINGDAAKTIAAAPLRSTGKIQVGGQEHFYLEGQVALAVPGEDGAMLVYSSTQHPSEVQHVTARVLGVPDSFVTCRVRRMGGGFGGKETQATQWAVLAAVAARMTGRPCKFRLDRDADMVMTGKRHDFAVEYSVGYDSDGRIRALDLDLDARCGCSADCSIGVVDRAMFHSDNAYFLPESRIYTRRVKTNTVSNTAFRGFGGPQGMMAIEP
jgi:xanthine dehydrogenase large subunit